MSEVRILPGPLFCSTSRSECWLLRAARGDKFEALYVLAVTTGMRQGELLGLNWDDIDLDEKTLRARRSTGRVEGASYLSCRLFVACFARVIRLL
ncbi:MAG: tyrosine-type recombinase/integrase [Actinobacteria bacterium]|nr:tyrosine-type recombinase/integrase [Actinomycetota bacterium]